MNDPYFPKLYGGYVIFSMRLVNHITVFEWYFLGSGEIYPEVFFPQHASRQAAILYESFLFCKIPEILCVCKSRPKK